MKYYILALKRYAEFSGRSSRKEFWFFKILDWLIACFFLAFRIAVEIETAPVFDWLWFIYTLGTFVPSIAVAVRRLHDTGHSGWWILVPFYNIYLLFKKGDEGYNEYGEDPIAWDNQ